MKYKLVVAVIGLAAVAVVGTVHATPWSSATTALSSAPVSPAPVFYWSTEARRAIVPPSAGSENFGNKFPGEAAVYMGIVHVAIYDAAVSIEGGYQPYTSTPTAPAGTSPEAAIATAAYDTLVGLQNTNKLRLSPAGKATLDADYAAYMG